MVCPISTCKAKNKSEPGLTKVLQLLIVLSLFTSGAKAAEDNLETELEEQSSNLPDMEFLEFLGSFETDSGEWVDPTELLQIEFELLLEDAELQKTKQPNDTSTDQLETDTS